MKPYLTLLLVLAVCTRAPAQNDGRYAGKQIIPFGITETIYSPKMGEERDLNIYLPPGYNPDSSQTYNVIYLLDAGVDEDYFHIAGMVDFLMLYKIISPSIVVGITNEDRKRDFTHPSTDSLDLEYMPTSGKSATFIKFLAMELQPYIEQNYRVSDTTTLIGQSLGGLLAVEVLLKEPDAFDRYIIVSPSLWWDRRSLLEQADNLVQREVMENKQVYLTVGENEHPEMVNVAEALAGKLAFFPGVIFEKQAGEDHATILHRAVYRALESTKSR